MLDAVPFFPIHLSPMSQREKSPSPTAARCRHAFLLALALGLPTLSLNSCATSQAAAGGGGLNSPMVAQRAAQIAAEPPGDYWVGRRYWTEGTRFWGYLRRPGEPWSQARLVMVNERQCHTPDRLAEDGPVGNRHGFDHNYEYRFYGRFTSERIYDPNSNLMLPEFMLQRYELVSSNPGFLFTPGERYNPKLLPSKLPAYPR